MQNNLSVTFAVICYNYGRYLRRALESCLIQRSPGVKTEVLVLDDGSTDETPEICRKYAGKIKVSALELLSPEQFERAVVTGYFFWMRMIFLLRQS